MSTDTRPIFVPRLINGVSFPQLASRSETGAWALLLGRISDPDGLPGLKARGYVVELWVGEKKK